MFIGEGYGEGTSVAYLEKRPTNHIIMLVLRLFYRDF